MRQGSKLALRLIHQSKGRARFRYSFDKGLELNAMSLQIALSAIENVKQVRINRTLNDIIIEYSKDLRGIEAKIHTLLQNELRQSTTKKAHKNESHFLRTEIPSSAEMVRA